MKSDLRSFIRLAAASTVESGTDPRTEVPGPVDESGAPIGSSPEAARAKADLTLRFGRAFLARVSDDELARQFPGLSPPLLLFTCSASFHCAAPAQARFGAVVELHSGIARPVDLPALAALADGLEDSAERIDETILVQAVSAAQRQIIPLVRKEMDDLRSTLVTLQSRKQRDIEAVFSQRLGDLERGRADREDGAALELERERRQAVSRVAEYFHPDRVETELDTGLLLVLHRAGHSKRPAVRREN